MCKQVVKEEYRVTLGVTKVTTAVYFLGIEKYNLYDIIFLYGMDG